MEPVFVDAAQLVHAVAALRDVPPVADDGRDRALAVKLRHVENKASSQLLFRALSPSLGAAVMRFAGAEGLSKATRMARIGEEPEEQEALEVICALEDVRSFEWLEAGTHQNVRTPDLRLELVDGRSVLVEVTMATSVETRQLLPLDGTKIKSDALTRWWRVRVTHRQSKGAEPGNTPKLKPLLPQLVPVLSDVESQGGTNETIRQHGEDRLHREMQVIDRDVEAIDRRVVRVTDAIPVGDGEKGGIEATPTVGGGVMPEGVDDLVSAVQHRINKKDDHGQGADWLAVAIDRVDAREQLDNAFGEGSDSNIDGAQDLRALDLRGYEEVWVFARSSDVPGHIVLRFSGSGATWKRSLVERASD